MALLRRKPNSRFWIACFRAPDGRHIQRSAKTTDKRLAQRIAEEFERASSIQATAAQTRKVITDLHKMVTGEVINFPTVSEYFAKWLGTKKGTISDATYVTYGAAASAFLEFLESGNDIELARITPDQITEFRDHAVEQVSPVTVNNRLKILRVIFKQAWRDGLIEENPAAKVPILKISKDSSIERRAFTKSELKKLLSSAEGEWPGLIRFGLYTGQRLGDIVRLRWENVDLEQNALTLSTRKTGRRQIIPIAPSLRAWIEKEKDSGQSKGPIFPQAFESTERAGKVSTLSRQFYDLMASIGMVPPKSHKKQPGGPGPRGRRQRAELSFHSLRHTATSMMKNAGISPAIVQEFVGHDSKIPKSSATITRTLNLQLYLKRRVHFRTASSRIANRGSACCLPYPNQNAAPDDRTPTAIGSWRC